MLKVLGVRAREGHVPSIRLYWRSFIATLTARRVVGDRRVGDSTSLGVAKFPRRRSRRRSLAVKQVANARERVLDIRRVSLEVRPNTAQEVGERSRIEPLYPVRIFARFSFCLLKRRSEFVLARLRGSCRLLKLPLESSQAPPEIVDDRTTRLREVHRLFSSRVRLRSVYEVEIDEEGSNGGGRGGCRDRSRSGGSNQRHRAGCGRLASPASCAKRQVDPFR